MSRLDLIQVFGNEDSEIFNKISHAYEMGRTARDKEYAEGNVFFSSRPIEDIVFEAMVDGYNQALDDFVEAMEKYQQENWISNLEYGLTFDDLESVKNELKK